MARIFKHQHTKPLPPGSKIITRSGRRYARYKDRRGRTQEARLSDGGDRIIRYTANWYVEFVDANGIRKRVPGFTDRKATDQYAAELERQAEREQTGLIDRFAEHRKRPLCEHLEVYKAHLDSRDMSEWYRQETLRRLRAVFDEARLTHIPEITSGNVEKFLKMLADKGTGPATRNTYLQSVKAFCAWLVDDDRIAEHPLQKLKPAVAETEIRRDRRALTEEEVARLLDTAHDRPLRDAMTIRHGPRKGQVVARIRPEERDRLERLGRERALIYKTLVLTGLRRGELEGLRWSDLHLDGDTAWLTVRASIAKNRKTETLPVHSDLAADLRSWQAEQRFPEAATPIFSVPTRLVLILDRDLKAAGIPKRDTDGRTIDVHALRHTTATWLSKVGVAPRTAQSLMRHSKLELTMGAYTDPRLLDQASAAEALPSLPLTKGEDPSVLATGTEG